MNTPVHPLKCVPSPELSLSDGNSSGDLVSTSELKYPSVELSASFFSFSHLSALIKLSKAVHLLFFCAGFILLLWASRISFTNVPTNIHGNTSYKCPAITRKTCT